MFKFIFVFSVHLSLFTPPHGRWKRGYCKPLTFSRGPLPTLQPSPCLPKESILWTGCSEITKQSAKHIEQDKGWKLWHLNNIKNWQLDVHFLQLTQQAEAQRFVPDEGRLSSLVCTYFFSISFLWGFGFHLYHQSNTHWPALFLTLVSCQSPPTLLQSELPPCWLLLYEENSLYLIHKLSHMIFKYAVSELFRLKTVF